MSIIDLSISIVNYKTYDLVNKCIISIKKHTKGISYEIILVDNASSFTEISKLKTTYPQIDIIQNKKNIGFAAANNQAYRRSSGRYFVLLNSDTELLNDALSILVKHMDQNKNCGISCPQLYYPDLRPQKSYSGFHSPYTRAKWEFTSKLNELKTLFKDSKKKKNKSINKIDYATKDVMEIERPRGVCFLIRRSTIKQIGLLDERFFMYDEEVDWALRAYKSGWINQIIPQAKVIHHWGGSTSNRTQLLDDIHTQSDFKFHLKHSGVKGWTILWLGHFIGVIIALLLGVLYSLSTSKNTKGKSTESFCEAFRLLRKLIILHLNLMPID